ncbi:MAG: hypothetical protein RSB23_06840 [Alistipes sp.]
MSMVFQFRMLSDENDNFLRDYELRSDATLLQFHKLILQTLEYEDCMASFFTADAKWEKLAEFTLLDMDDKTENAPQLMENVTLEQVLHHIHDRLIYLFDVFGDRSYYLELMSVYAADKEACYPREIYAQADAPDQYDPSILVEDDGSIFAEAMDDFDEFEGNENYDDE